MHFVWLCDLLSDLRDRIHVVESERSSQFVVINLDKQSMLHKS